jgi:hypothetical protein
MSMALAIRQNGFVYMAVDSVAASADTTVIRKETKMFWNGEYLIAFVGSFRYGQAVKFCSLPRFPENLLTENLPEKSADQKSAYENLPQENLLERWFVTEWIPNIKSAMWDGGVDSEDIDCSSMLVAVGPWLLVVEGFQVSSYQHDHAALGVAEQAGLVGLDVLTKTWGGPPETILQLVLDSIEQHSIYVKRPWYIATTATPLLEN